MFGTGLCLKNSCDEPQSITDVTRHQTDKYYKVYNTLLFWCCEYNCNKFFFTHEGYSLRSEKRLEVPVRKELKKCKSVALALCYLSAVWLAFVLSPQVSHVNQMQ